LQIMEAMALHLESSYEKLYRWSQGRLIAVIIHQCITIEQYCLSFIHLKEPVKHTLYILE